LGLTGDWPSSSHTGNRADYLPHIIEKVYMRTMNMNTVLEFSSTSVHQQRDRYREREPDGVGRRNLQRHHHSSRFRIDQ
jgi:hypothetical protein